MDPLPTRVMTSEESEESDGGAEMEGELQMHLTTMHGCVTVHALLLQRLETSQNAVYDLC